MRRFSCLIAVTLLIGLFMCFPMVSVASEAYSPANYGRDRPVVPIPTPSPTQSPAPSPTVKENGRTFSMNLDMYNFSMMIVNHVKSKLFVLDLGMPSETWSMDGLNVRNLGEFKLTAYCPCPQCCGQWADGITATGTYAIANHTIAVDPKIIPYGSIVYILGHKYVAEDCGGAIKGNRIDIYFDTHQEALNFGVQYADVYLDLDVG